MQAPTLFISYSHDSEPHRRRVLDLADRLRRDGVDAQLDRYEAAPVRGWPMWMLDQVHEADFVLMVCTQTYHRRLMKREQPGLGLGGAWEGHLILTSFYEAGACSAKFIPVVFGQQDLAWIPLPFQAVTRYCLDGEDGYAALLARVRGVDAAPGGTHPWHPASPSPRQAKWDVRPAFRLRGVPTVPRLFLGRQQNVQDFKQVLGILPQGEAAPEAASEPARTASIHGLPGVGKTTFVSALPYDADVRATYPDGILWTAFGQGNPRDVQVKLLSTLSDWAAKWERDANPPAHTLPQALSHWRERLRGRRVLLVIDDVWDANLAHRLDDIVDTGGSAVITCRTPAIAERVTPVAAQRFTLDELGHDGAMELLSALAPGVVNDLRSDCESLVDELGRLPLAIVVAGSMLGSARGRAIGARKLLTRLRTGQALLEGIVPANMLPLLDAKVPADMLPLLDDTTVSVANLLWRSVRLLDEVDQVRFAQLGVFAPKPASISLQRMASVWQLDETEALNTAALLVDQGLLQVAQDGRYLLHALLARLAEGMLQRL